ncbi:MAG: ATP-binding protein, partial [Proteobacteria bacterium]
MSKHPALPVAFCPFPGIRPYRENESRFFYGREDHLSQVFNLLAKNQFAAILGTSGAGKSSLINAGLLPIINMLQNADSSNGRWQDKGDDWEQPPQIIRMTPGDGPVRRLAKGLCSGAGKHRQGNSCNECKEWENTLRRGSSHAEHRLYEEFDIRIRPLIIIVDQFEEMFHWLRSETEARPHHAERLVSDAQVFVRRLLELRRLPGIFLIMGMRSDYLKDCSNYPDLAAAIADSLFVIPRLKWGELRQAIIAPLLLPEIAIQIDGPPSETITNRLLNQLTSLPVTEADTLPLMQDLLARAWHGAHALAVAGQKEKVDFCGFLSGLLDSDLVIPSGRLLLAESLDNRGDELSAKTGVPLLSLRLFFAALLRIDSDGRVVRRPLRRSQMEEFTKLGEKDTQKILAVFSADPPAWILVSNAEDPLIDIAHEALLRHWRLFSHPNGIPLQKSPSRDLTMEGLRMAVQLRLSRKQLISIISVISQGKKNSRQVSEIPETNRQKPESLALSHALEGVLKILSNNNTILSHNVQI